MSKLQTEYNKLIEKKRQNFEEIKALEGNKIVKRYLELKRKNAEINTQQSALYKRIKEEYFSSCNHILVYSKIDYDKYEGRTYRSCGCIKCGLDNSVLEKDKEFLSFYESIMYEYLIEKHLSGIETNITCDLNLAHAIYLKIKEAHPNIDDENIIKYFKIALDDIRNIKVSEDRKYKRAKRLSLTPGFKKWNARDVHND